jgi:hypothetical protein
MTANMLQMASPSSKATSRPCSNPSWNWAYVGCFYMQEACRLDDDHSDAISDVKARAMYNLLPSKLEIRTLLSMESTAKMLALQLLEASLEEKCTLPYFGSICEGGQPI